MAPNWCGLNPARPAGASLLALRPGAIQRTSSSRSSHRTAQQPAQCSLARQLGLTAAGAAALTLGVAVVLRGRQQQQHQAHHPAQGTGGWRGGGGEQGCVSWGWLPLPGQERRLALQVQGIEKQRQREAQAALQRWDQRFRLRTQPLAELRALAQRHRIAGRSRMRKRELVAALELAMGYGGRTVSQL